jgi:hypothetical protein
MYESSTPNVGRIAGCGFMDSDPMMVLLNTSIPVLHLA